MKSKKKGSKYKAQNGIENEQRLKQAQSRGLIQTNEEEGYPLSFDKVAPPPAESVGTGQYDFHPAFKAFNAVAQLMTGAANRATDMTNNKEEYRQWVKALQPEAYENYNEEGLNDQPMVMQNGGSVYDYMESKGMDGSYKNRKKLFNSMFEGKYEGTAEQNTALLKHLETAKPGAKPNKYMTPSKAKEQYVSAADRFNAPAPKATAKAAPAPKAGVKPNKFMTAPAPAGKATYESAAERFNAPAPKAAKAAPKSNKLQSGVIVDKRTGKAYVIKDGKKGREFDVLTGKNPNSNTGAEWYAEADADESKRVTPVGAYKMEGKPTDAAKYEGNIFKMAGIPAFGMNAPVSKGVAIHQQPLNTPERTKLYGTDSPWASYGCINCKKPDIQKLMKEFPQGDTLQVIDSQMPEYKNHMNKYQTGGLNPKQMSDWNGFLDFVKSKGLEGSTDLNKKDKNMGESLFNEYKTNKPDLSIDYSIVPTVQQEMQRLRDNTQSFLKRKGDPSADSVMTGVSKVDGWFGSKTSQFRFPDSQLNQYHNGELANSQQLGLVDGSLRATGAPAQMAAPGAAPMTTSKPLPKGVKLERLRDASGREGDYYEDPNTGDMVEHRQTGGQVSQTIEAEEGEVYQTPEGALKKVDEGAGTHEEGGVLIDDAQRVLEDTSDKRKDKASQALRVSPDLVETLTGFRPKTALSHSKAMEFAKEKIKSDISRVESKIKRNVDNVEKNAKDKYANSSLKFNTMNLQGKLTEGDIFDSLFEHQEIVKQTMGISNPKAQFGGKYDLAQNGLQNYPGAKTKGGRFTPTGKDVNDLSGAISLEDFKAKWKEIGVNMDDAKSVEEAQGRAYDYLLQSEGGQEVLKGMWNEFGNTNAGESKKILADRFPDGNFSKGKLTKEDLVALRAGYVDNMFGPRRLVPGQTINLDVPQAPDAVPTVAEPTPADPVKPTETATKFNQPKSRFQENLNWFDVAGEVTSLAEGRIPVRYNDMDFEDIRMKLQNPLPTLQAGQRDFNAAIENMPANSQGYANTANLFAKKYGIDAQVLGQYENINSEIKNKETVANADIHNKEAEADYGSREAFERKWLGSKEALRSQRRADWDSIYTKMAQNKKLNREGNLLMQLFPSFDQNAEYNGYRVPVHAPTSMSTTPASVPVAQGQTPAKAAKEPQRFISLTNGKKIYF